MLSLDVVWVSANPVEQMLLRPGCWGLSKSERANYWRKSNLSKLYSLSTSTLQSDFQGINSRSRVYTKQGLRYEPRRRSWLVTQSCSPRKIAWRRKSVRLLLHAVTVLGRYNLLSRWNNFAPINVNNSTVCGAKKIDTNLIGVSRCLSSYPFVQQHYWCLMVRKYDL